MSSQSGVQDTDVSARPSLTVGYLLRFSWPLMAMFLMMSAAPPIIQQGIAVSKDEHDEPIHLSAFLLVATVAVFIYSGTFVSRDVANRTVTDRSSLWHFTWFFMFWSAVSAGVLVLVSQFEPLRRLVLIKWMGGSPQDEALAVKGLLIFAGAPFLLSLRGLGQGCHISNGETWYLTVGTALRLIAIAVFVYGFAIWSDMSGPVMGATTYMIAMTVETVYVLLTLRSKPQWTRVRHGAVLTFSQFTRYAFPLMLGSLTLQFVPPLLVAIIHQGHLPPENRSAFGMVRDSYFFLAALLLLVQPAVVTHATSLRNFRLVLRLCVWITVAITAIIALLAVPLLRDLVFVHCFRLDNRVVLSLIGTGLLWFLPAPALMFLNYLVTALHTRSGRTIWVTAGNLAGLAVLAAMARGLRLAAHEGVVLAAAGNLGFLLVSTLVQAIGLLGGGFSAAIDPSSLAERLQKTAKLSSEPSPEAVPQTVTQRSS
jgi:hypothetical protein